MMSKRSLVDLEEVRRHWGLHLALGIILLVLGGVAITYAFATSLVSVLLFGWLLVGSGLAQAILAFRVQSWGSPKTLLEKLRRRREIVGDFELSVIVRYGSLSAERALASMRLFAAEVIPELHRW